jgi:hypothetical protein
MEYLGPEAFTDGKTLLMDPLMLIPIKTTKAIARVAAAIVSAASKIATTISCPPNY